MWQAVTVGGPIVVEDADFEGSFCDPPNAGFTFWVDACQRVLERHGGDPQLGRTLRRLFPAAGIPEPAITLALADRRHRREQDPALFHGVGHRKPTPTISAPE